VVLAGQVHTRHPVWVRIRNGSALVGRRLAAAPATAAGSGDLQSGGDQVVQLAQVAGAVEDHEHLPAGPGIKRA
jgi:hypothetical protein